MYDTSVRTGHWNRFGTHNIIDAIVCDILISIRRYNILHSLRVEREIMESMPVSIIKRVV